jgi:hypothetical protein
MTFHHRALGILLVGTASALSAVVAAQSPVEVVRKVYVTAFDQRGGPITDLTMADVTVREGRDRQIASLEPSRDRLKIALAIDELLAGDSVIRRAVLRFREQVRESADVALFLVGRRNEKRADYASDLGTFLNAINGLPTRPTYPGSLVESLYEIAKEQRTLEGRRVIVALAPEMGQISNVTANAVLDVLRDSGGSLYAATIVVGPGSGGRLVEDPTTRLEGGDLTAIVERDRVLNDGTKQSGGLRLPSMNVQAFTPALDRVVSEITHQYVVSYIMPAGTKSDGRVTIGTRRRGITVRGPNRLPGL